MKKGKQLCGFEISLSGRNDGTLEAAYIRFKTTKVAKTVEVTQDTIFADYDSKGDLVGIELLAPAPLSKLVKLVDEDRRPEFRRFAKSAVPADLIAA